MPHFPYLVIHIFSMVLTCYASIAKLYLLILIVYSYLIIMTEDVQTLSISDISGLRFSNKPSKEDWRYIIELHNECLPVKYNSFFYKY